MTINMVETIKFVAIGNSLTVGFLSSPYLTNQPYSNFLKEISNDYLKQLRIKDNFEIKIINRGINGDLTSNMLSRFQRDVIELKPNYVIILGGTNDMGWRLPIFEIFCNLKKMFKMALDNKIEPIVCTVPSILGWDEGIPPRLKLNQFLQHFCRENKILTVDLFTKTCDIETKRLRSNYSIDGLHLNALGYQMIAETIFEDAIKILLNSLFSPTI